MQTLNKKTPFQTSTFSGIISLAIAVFLSACEEVKTNQEESVPVPLALDGFNGEWKTDLLTFDKDQCAFHMKANSDVSELTIQTLVVACVANGTDGLYLPLKMKILERSTVTPEVLTEIGGPETAQILGFETSNGLNARGWIDSSNPRIRAFAVKITSWDNPMFNRLEMHGVLRGDGTLAVSGLKLRDGWNVTDTIVLRRDTIKAGEYLSGRSPWSRLSLPPDAVVSTARENQNFLFCVDKKDPRIQALVDLKKPRYWLSGGTIGEIGFFNADDNRVYPWGSYSGSVSKDTAMTEYSLSVTGVGGRTSIFHIAIAADGSGLLMTGGGTVPHTCRAIQNDVFARYYGWNP